MTGLDEQLTKYLTDVHSIEEQALAQMRLAPRLAGDPELKRVFAEHLTETEEQERRVRVLLIERGAKPAPVKDVAGRVGGWGMMLFARVNPDTPGKLAMHAFSYEHMELAAYELLRRIAVGAGDEGVRAMAQRIGEQERAMADRLDGCWDRAVEASLRAKGAEDISKDLVKYLRDAHSLEAQALQLLETGPRIVDLEALAAAFRDHLEQTREHQRLVEERLVQQGARPSRFQAGAMRAAALNHGVFFRAQPDTPVKLAGLRIAFETISVATSAAFERSSSGASSSHSLTARRAVRTAGRSSGNCSVRVSLTTATRLECPQSALGYP